MNSAKEFVDGFVAASQTWNKVFLYSDVTRSRVFLLLSYCIQLSYLDPKKTEEYSMKATELKSDLDNLISKWYKQLDSMLEESSTRINPEMHFILKTGMDVVFGQCEDFKAQ